MKQKKPAKETYHHGDLRSALLKQAVQLISKGGVAQLTLREVSRKAGVSHTAPYRHFKDKNALLAAVAGEGFLLLEKEMAEVSVGRIGLERLHAMGIAYVSFANQNPYSYRVMFGPELQRREVNAEEALKVAARAPLAVLEVAIRECQAAGLMKKREPQELALICWSMVHGLAGLTIDGQLKNTRWESKETADRMIMAVVDSLR